MTRANKLTAPEVLDVSGLARLVGVGERTVRRMEREGAFPERVMVGHLRRWRRRELIDWLAAGCPHRDSWEWFPAQYWTLEQATRSKRIELQKLLEDIHDAERRLNQLHKGLPHGT